jgi:hypothetical protein
MVKLIDYIVRSSRLAVLKTCLSCGDEEFFYIERMCWKPRGRSKVDEALASGVGLADCGLLVLKNSCIGRHYGSDDLALR